LKHHRLFVSQFSIVFSSAFGRGDKYVALTCIEFGGGNAAGAGDGAGGREKILRSLTSAKFSPGPLLLLTGRPVVGKSDFLGTAAGLGVVVVCSVCGVDANTTDPPSDP
jgi:hypothetical protein